MPLSYSDLDFNNGQYIPQYAGIPLEQIQNTAETLANRHYSNIANANSLQILQNQIKSQALEGAKPYFDQHIQAVDEALQDMAKNGGENSSARINALATKFQGDQGMLQAMQNAKQVNSIQEQINKITSESGKDAVYHKDKLEAMRKAPVMIKGEDGNETLNPLYSSQFNLPVSAYLDPTLDFKRITDEIKPDAWLSQGLKGEALITFQKAHTQLANGEIDVPKFVSYMKSAGVTGEKLKRLEDRMFQAYKNTKSYEQQKEYFGADDGKLRNEIFNYAKLGQYQQDDKHFMQVSGSEGKGAGDKPINLLGDMLDPAVIDSKVRPKLPGDMAGEGPNTTYNYADPGGQFTKVNSEEQRIANKDKDANAVKFFKAMTEATGYNPNVPAPGGESKPLTDEEMASHAITPAGIQKTKEWLNSVYTDELSNAYTQPAPKESVGKELDAILTRNPTNLNYYDIDGKLVYGAKNNGSMTKEWKELTGGDPTKFTYGNTLSPYNLRAEQIAEDAAASGLHAVSAMTDDGLKTFYVSNPAAINSNRPATNTNIIYNKVMAQPGVYTKLGSGVEAKYLVGNQKEVAWDEYKQDFITKAQGDENTARNMFDYMASQGALIEYKLPTGETKLGTPASMALDLPSLRLSYKK